MIGQAKQIHQSCCLPGRSVMNNLSMMTDVLDVWLPGITAVTEACCDPEAAEGQWCKLKDEQELQTGCFLFLQSCCQATLFAFWSPNPC